MGNQKQKGFTIIEVVLFLAISSLLLASLLFGINTSINQQRYKDSVVSLIGLLQEQYTLAANVNSQRTSEWTCDVDAPAVSPAADNARGTTDCVVVGRLVQIKNGDAVTTANIVAYKVNEALLKASSSDIQAFTDAVELAALTDTSGTSAVSVVDSYTLNWGSKAKILNRVGDVVGSGDAITIAILRSPVTGTTSTYVVNEATQDWDGKIVTQTSRDRAAIICLVPPGALAGGQQAVLVNAASSNASGVSQRPGVAGC
ncbi:prepilin-type N-terminal cleavage/methylation domain-containing protein [Candidatus Saccharibacteria bacterium]|nr:prepilin-type N-terminal cleavage/methylation domain-containing protein [Candidatus Saccharibacteria bacterium]